jgi:peptidoglycan/xylan/chitin deacetylase (PgdA/CDA1 family)
LSERTGQNNAVWKRGARVLLHDLGGLALLRWKNRKKYRILMFHAFSESGLGTLEAHCTYLARHFEPVTLSRLVDAIEGHMFLPDNAVTITVDDGYKNFLQYGHPVLHRHRIPATVYAVSGFVDGRLWLWWDQIEFALEHTSMKSFHGTIEGNPVEFPLGSAAEEAEAFRSLVEILKVVPNGARLEFMANLGEFTAVDVPAQPPPDRAAMTWDDLRAIAAEGVEIGCHTDTHLILSRIFDQVEMNREVKGAKALIEERLGLPVRHFSYPNGTPIDIGNLARAAVTEAGYASAVTTKTGLNTSLSERLQLCRLPYENDLDLYYGAELLAGLHI